MRPSLIVTAGGMFGLALLASLVTGSPLAYWAAMVTGLMFIGSLFERFRYKALLSRQSASPAWEETAERFIDPETGRLVTVFYDPRTGERHYVAEPGPRA